MGEQSLAVKIMRETVNARTIINGTEADNKIIRLSKMKHRFAWDAYIAGSANHWSPQEISMAEDVAQWNSGRLTDDEKRVVKIALGFFTTADSIVANNLVLAVYKHVTSPECRAFLLRQALEEVIHTHAYQHIVESLGMDEDEIYTMYQEVKEIRDKDRFVMNLCDAITDPTFKTGTFGSDQKFLENLVDFYLIMEGVFFYSSFAAILSLKRRNLMARTAEQFEYIMRDESMHLNFGIDLINQIKLERPDLWDLKMQHRVREKLAQAAELEAAYAGYMMPRGILGLNAEAFGDYTKYIADRRAQSVGLAPLFSATNPFQWMGEVVDGRKSKLFFETKITEYKSGGALNDLDF